METKPENQDMPPKPDIPDVQLRLAQSVPKFHSVTLTRRTEAGHERQFRPPCDCISVNIQAF